MDGFDQTLAQKVSESLKIPVRLLRQWQREGAITVQAIDGGWHLVMHKEPAMTLITMAATDGAKVRR